MNVAALQELMPHGMPKGVRVWRLELDFQNGQPHELLALLSQEERNRCLRYRQPTDQFRFAATRAALRHLLAERLRIPIEKIALDLNSFGKPRLSNEGLPFFNLSHSGKFALIALSAYRPVGVDIEALSSEVTAHAIRRLLTPDERLFCDQNPDAVFRIWSGKEAVLKAWGIGIAKHFQSVSVVPATAGHYAVSFSTEAPAIEAWQLPAPAGFVAALALSSA